MPSHIFTRIGLWQESIQSNLGAVAASKAYAAKVHPEAAYYEHLHALDYLAYAYLQGAQDREAKSVLDELRAIKKVQPEAFQAAYAFAAIPARYALERRRWTEAAALTVTNHVSMESFSLVGGGYTFRPRHGICTQRQCCECSKGHRKTRVAPGCLSQG